MLSLTMLNTMLLPLAQLNLKVVEVLQSGFVLVLSVFLLLRGSSTKVS